MAAVAADEQDSHFVCMEWGYQWPLALCLWLRALATPPSRLLGSVVPLPRVAEVVQAESVNEAIQTESSSICGEGSEQNAGSSVVEETEQQQVRLE